jgi:hypothetical protein
VQKQTVLEWLLVTVIGALLCVVALFVLSSPMWWSWCLSRLDARGWNHWTWTGVVVALVLALTVIRFYGQE